MTLFALCSAIVDSLLEHSFLFGVTLAVFYYVLNRETRNIPPGPTGLPVLGYIPFLSNQTGHEQLTELSKKYGSILSVKLGLNNCVFIHDYKSAIEVLNHEAFQDRPSHNLFTLVSGSDDNLISWKGQLWKEHRRFILRALRAVGVGKPEMEQLIGGEISYMLDQIAKDGKDGAQEVLVGKYLTPSTSNVVNAVITGKRFDYDHPFRVKQDATFSRDSQPATPWTGYVVNFCKLLLPFRKIPVGLNKLLAQLDEVLLGFVSEEVESQKKTYQLDGDANIITAYLTECDSKKDDAHNSLFDPKRIPGLASNLMGAGSGTVKDALQWAFMHCAVYPDIQDKVIEELANVIGYDRKPTYADRKNMPYTQAFLWESMRHATSIPINLPHIASRDIEICGFTIPKDYHVYVNFFAIHNDPNYWDQPETFNVERFLTPEGDKLVKHEAFMPFSAGRRSCPGEPLAQVELFVYLVMTLQRYKIQPPDGVRLSLDGNMAGFSWVPKKLQLVFAKRQY